MNELYLNINPFAEIITVVDSASGRPLRIDFEDRTERLRVGSVHDAVVSAVVPELSGCFLRLGSGESVFAPNKYLTPHSGEGTNARSRDLIRVGERLRVVIRKPERQGKRAVVALAAESDEPGPASPGDGQDPDFQALRTRIEDAVRVHRPKHIHVEDAVQKRLFPDVERENAIFTVRPGLQIDLSAFAARRKRREVEIVVDETEALTVIDVNSGNFRGGRYEANQLAAGMILDEVLATEISGMILIDFIDMDAVMRGIFLDELRRSGYNRSRGITLHGFTSLGILEMTRAKRTRSLREKLTSRGLYDAIRLYYELRHEIRSGAGADGGAIRAEVSEEIYKLYLEHGAIAPMDGPVDLKLAPRWRAYRIEAGKLSREQKARD